MLTRSLDSIDITAVYRCQTAQNSLICWCTTSSYDSSGWRRQTKSFSMTSHREKLALNQCPDLQMNISISWETFYENWLTYINNLWKIDCNLIRRIKFLHFNFIYTIKSFSLEILENIAMKANWMYSTVSLLSDAWVWNIKSELCWWKNL